MPTSTAAPPDRLERTEPQISSPPPSTPPRQPQKPRPREPLGRRGLFWTLGLAVFALVLLFVAGHFDEYLRRTLETKINQRLHGYSVSLGHAHLSPFNLSLTLERAVIRQQANPNPPVADIPRLTASVEWREILSRHLVADAVFVQPRVHVNLPQLRAENRDRVNLQDRGWQQALESIYPLKFNLIQVRDGEMVYIDTDPKRPLHVSHWNLLASNIRNIHSRERVYPSPVHSDGVIFDTGRGVVDGHADFLAEPYPGIHAVYRVENVPLNRLRPVVSRANVTVSGGILASRGEVEVGPKHREARIADVTVRGLRLDYTNTPGTTAAEKARARAVKKVAEDQTPAMAFHVDRLRLADSRLGLISVIKDRRLRFFLSDTNLDVTHLSAGFRDGPATAKLTGRFMGIGAARATAHFRADRNGPDFDLIAAVEKASLPSINELLRAYGKFDVTEGTFSVYSEIRVRNGRIDGYVKPLFENVKVYDPEQDKKKPVLRKLYEKIVGGLSHILENKPRDQVATVADISGTIEDPNTSAWEIAVRLVSNAFIKAILPGFEREVEAYRHRRR
jgi:hypothetical protein